VFIYDRALSFSEVGQRMNGAAIPEPSVMVMLAAGLTAVVLAAQRRRVR